MRTPDEIVAAMKVAKPGDSLVMANGTWKDADILFQGRGEEGRPITLRTETPGQVILSGSSHLRIAGEYLVVDGLWFKDGYYAGHVVAFRASSDALADHCRLTNTAIVDYNPPDKKTDSRWVSLYGTYNRVDHCLLKGKVSAGTTLVVWISGKPNYHLIDHNSFLARPPLGENGGETIRVGTSDVSLTDSRTTVEYNYFEECNGEIEIISSKSCENVYRYNTFMNCEGALTLRHGNRCRVEGNLFLGNERRATGGVRVIGEDHTVINNYFCGLTGDESRSALSLKNGIPDSPLAGYFQVQRALIAFNTFVGCRHNIAIGVGDSEEESLPPRDCTIANNIITGKDAPLIEQFAEPIGMTWLGNIAYGAELGIPVNPGIRIVDPKLVQGADGLWRPAPGSPAIGAAAGKYAVVTEDIDGQMRGTRKDVGCDQSSKEPVKRRPIGAEDVGPGWMRGT